MAGAARSAAVSRVKTRCPTCGDDFEDDAIERCPRDGALLEPLELEGSSTHVDRVVGGRYRVLGLLGEGGMGAVYVGEHTLSLRRVAMKIMRPELEQDPTVRERFLRECQTLERLKSPYVVDVLEAGESAAGEIYIVMELLEGGTLGDLLEQGPVEPARVIDIGIQIAEALAVVHREGVVHRDLKPDNVFLCRDGTLRVLDFGIARLFDQTAAGRQRKLTTDGTVMGTPIYLSPEGAAGRDVGPAGDLYALGVILFELLAGEPPFIHDEPLMLMGMHLKTPPPSLDARRPGLPPALVSLIASLLAKKPEERPVDAAVVARRLRALARGADTAPMETRRVPRALLLGVLVGVVVVIVAALGAAGAVYLVRRERAEPPTTTLPMETEASPPDQDPARR